MTTFLIISALFALGATALVVVPLLRPRADALAPALKTAVLSAVLLLAGAGALYTVWSTWSWKNPVDEAGTPEGMVGRLARRLESNPDDLNGWLLLGRSYGQLGQYPLSAKAYRRADRLATGRSADALAGLAEALILGEQSDLKGEAGRLFEKALEVEPRSIKALFYGALGAADRGDSALARTRFQQLLTSDTPPDVRRLIEQQVAALDVEAQQRGQPQTPAAAQGPTLRLRIVLDPAVAARATAGAPLFVSVRIAGQGGPPLAARRLEAHFPQDVDLSSADAMIAGRSFTDGQELEITARIANGGSAASRPGDPVGTVRYQPKAGGQDSPRIDLNIKALTP